MKNNEIEMNKTERPEGLAIDAAELLSMGDGHVGYMKKLNEAEIADLNIELELKNAWGIFSAKGEALAICDSTRAAFEFFTDHQLRPISLN